jgi:hypothetical protein
MSPKDLRDIHLEDLALEPLDARDSREMNLAPKPPARRANERRKGGDRRGDVRIENDRRDRGRKAPRG